MAEEKIFIIDFDSTFTKVEALDLLGRISLADNPEKEAILREIEEITALAMEGKISFYESLTKRIQLLGAHRSHLEPLIEQLQENISTSFIRNRDFFKKYTDQIIIISSGFKEFILPIVSRLGIKEELVYANTFTFDEQGKITGFDKQNPLAHDHGKVDLLKGMNLHEDVYVIGDGYTDYQMRAAGLANKFYAFTENVERPTVLQKADHIAPSLDEILYLNKMNTAISYPKNRIKVLLLENIHPKAAETLREEGYTVETYSAGMNEDELAEKIQDVSVLGIRSKTQLTAKVLEKAKRLIAVGAFCIGTNQIDLKACLQKGIAVFNAPFSNTRSVVELAIAEMICLLRNIPDKFMQMHQGEWRKSASGSYEIRGKKLGIVGYGNIGAQLSVVAEAIGMKVFYYDITEKLALGNATKCNSLQELLQTADIISLHVDGRKENTDMISAREFEQMKQGAVFLNLSRGHVVNIEALSKALQNGKLHGAAVDVFPEEPKSNQEEFQSALGGAANTLLTPHIGGSTMEAQENIGEFVPMKIIDYINTGKTTNSVNFPNVQLPALENAHRLLHIHQNQPGILAKINQILAKHSINISGQYLKTNETIGYVITDIDKEYGDEVIRDLKNIEQTIRFRVLY